MPVVPLALVALRNFPANGRPLPADPEALRGATRSTWLALESACAAPAIQEQLGRFLSPKQAAVLQQQLEVLLDLLAQSGLETDDAEVRRRLAEELRSARQADLLGGPFHEESDPSGDPVECVAAGLEEAGYPTVAQLVELRSPWGEPLLLGILHFFLGRTLRETTDDSWRCLEMLARVLEEHGQQVALLLDQPEASPSPNPEEESARAGERLRQLGERCFRRGDYRRAAEHFSAAARLLPADAQLYWQRGEAYRLLCEYERALADLTLALRFSPQEPGILVSRAIAYHHSGEQARAVADCDAALALDPACLGAYRTRAAAHAATAAPELALTDLTRIIELEADDEALYLRGVLHARRRDYASAIADFNRALALNRYHVPALLQRGHAHRREGHYAEAIRDYGEVLRHHPSNAPAYSGRGLAFKLSGDGVRALADLTEALRLDPASVPDYYHRGVLHRSRGDLTRARADLDEAIRLQPESWVLRYVRGKILLAQGEYRPALLDLTEVVRLHASFLPAYLSRALAHDRLGQHHDAIQDGASAIALDPSSPAAWLVRGVVHAHRGDLAAALEDLSAAIRLDQRFALAYHERGMAYTLRGDHDGALADCHRLVALEPANARAYVLRSIVYHYKGEVEQALNDYARALQIDPKGVMAGWNEGLAEGARKEATQRLADYIDGLRPEEAAVPPPPSEFRIVIEPEKAGVPRGPAARRPVARKRLPRPVPAPAPTETAIEAGAEETVEEPSLEKQPDTAHPDEPAAEELLLRLAEEPEEDTPPPAEPPARSRALSESGDRPTPRISSPVRENAGAATTAPGGEAGESLTCPNCRRETVPTRVSADRVRCGNCQHMFPPWLRPRPKQAEDKDTSSRASSKYLVGAAAAVVVPLLFVAGRGWFGNTDKVPVHPAQGKATFDGKPMANATVFLHPTGVKNPDYPRPRGLVREDGTFTLGTYTKDDGAPAGEYAVTVQWLRKLPGRDLPASVLPPRYAKPETSGLVVRIEAGDNNLPAIKLTGRGR